MRRSHEDEAREVIYGVHPVLEALEHRCRSLERVLVAREGRGHGIGRALRLARAAGIPVSHVDRASLGRRLGRGAAHQGLAAIVSAVPYADAEELCAAAAGRADAILLALDRVTDTGNLGAVIRTAAAAGAAGLLLSADETAGLGPGVAKASAGALERLPVARERLLGRRLGRLGAAGFRVVALVPEGDASWHQVDLRGRIVLVAGGEERGPRAGVLEACELRAAIPLAGGLDSLNVSVAVGVALFEAVRQRRVPRHGS